MSTAEWIMQVEDMSMIIYQLKIFMILVSTYMIFLKISNNNDNNKLYHLIVIFIVFIISIFASIIKYNFNNYYSIIFQIFMLSLLFYKYQKDMIYTLMTTIVSIAISYIILFVSVFISLIIAILFNISNDKISFIFLIIFYIFILSRLFKIRKIKKGIIFLQRKLENQYFSVLVLNVSIVILLIALIIPEYKYEFTANMLISFIIIAIMLFITIKKLLELYYKQNLLIQDLEDTRYELEKFRNENKKLEKENLELSKKSHSLAHKQNSLEYKLDMIMKNTEFAKELDIVDRVKNLADEVYKSPKAMYIPKTGIQNIDDIFCYMQNECVKNNIDFRLKIYGNIYQMINNFVTKEELEILIADHIKDAIIAINHCDNINRSILVKLGKINKIYSLYIYDSGIEFEIETLKMLGSKPVSTHKESGGTGLGFMNTFDTIKRRKATLIIKEYNKPCKENYTKVIIIKFNNEYEFKIDSYRNLKTLKERNEII